MIYLTGAAGSGLRAELARRPPRTDLGLLLAPRPSLFSAVDDFPVGYAYDNGAFGAFRRGEPFDAACWRRGLARLDRRALFVTVPDAVGDHAGTLAAWRTYLPEVVAAGQPPAFALQNGCESFADVPPEAAAVFIGGDDAFKLSETAARICWSAREAGLWVHMGRASSKKRLLRALAMGVDSADGTLLRFGAPAAMLDRLDVMLAATRREGAQLDLMDRIG